MIHQGPLQGQVPRVCSASPKPTWGLKHAFFAFVPNCRLIERPRDVMKYLARTLRAERAGGGGGRIYTISNTAEDASGNSGTETVDVTVPHNQ